MKIRFHVLSLMVFLFCGVASAYDLSDLNDFWESSITSEIDDSQKTMSLFYNFPEGVTQLNKIYRGYISLPDGSLQDCRAKKMSKTRFFLRCVCDDDDASCVVNDVEITFLNRDEFSWKVLNHQIPLFTFKRVQ